MGRIPEATIRAILDRTDIVTVIGDFVRLERRGSRYLGLCPFHGEKTPSFNVDKEKGLFYCFGCQKGGDTVKFLMEYEKLSYREALEELAQKAGVPIELEEEVSEEEKQRRSLKEMNERLVETFHWLLLNHPAAANACSVLERRAIPEAVRDGFRLGYSLPSRRWLYDFLQKKGYSGEFLARSGLFSQNHPDFPLFADRLMFPIASSRGEIIGFGGRLLEGEGPKYINSPDTALFRKQDNLFALDKAIPALKKEGAALICEGYMDALSFHVAGVGIAVAPLGTALTEGQARLLKRWVQRVYLAFDADQAGQKAAEKATILAASAGLEAKVVILPGGKDASEILEKEGGGSLQKVRDLAINGDEFLVQRARSLYDIGSVEGKAKATSFLYPYINALDSEVKKDAFIELASRGLHAEARSFRADYEDAKRGIPARRAEKPAQGQDRPLVRSPDLILVLAVAVNEGAFANFRKVVSLEEIDDPRAKDLFIALEESYRAEEGGLESLLARLTDEQLRKAVLAAAVSGEFDENAIRFVDEGVQRLKRKSLGEKRELLRERIAELGSTGEGLSELQYELMHLDAELAKMKGERDERS